MKITMNLNGEALTADVEARQSLVDFVRANGLTGTHTGCEHGVCGACSVRVGGKVVRGCLMLAVQADGMRVETIEGVTQTGEIADLQDAFHRRNALQCGFCTAGMLLTAAELLTARPSPSRDEIREYLSGNYCRCTGYQAIIDAVADTAAGRARDDAG
jgi:aerobic carbon-monoxide dehydrogenase small subunit